VVHDVLPQPLQQRQRCHRPGVTAGLSPLSLDEIDAGGYRRQRRLRSVYLSRYQDSAGLQSLHVLPPDLPERQGDQRRTLCDRRLQQLRAIRKRPGGVAAATGAGC
jgi:hypothetical protein